MVHDYESPTKRRLSITGAAVPTARPRLAAGRRGVATACMPVMPVAELVGLSDLGDALLVHILSLIEDSQQRHRAALVCRRLRRLCRSPELLQHLTVSLGGGDPQQFLPRLAALARFLQSAGGHVQRLQLELRVPADAPGPATRRAFKQLKAALAAACPNLAQLLIQLDTTVKASSWLAQLPGLRQLELHSAAGLRLTADLSASHQLRELRLRGGGGLRVATAAALPASLTALELCGSKDEALPPQVAALPQLRALTVGNAGCTTAGFCLLAELGGSLQSLALRRCDYLPAAVTLQCLPRLQSLELAGCCPGDGPLMNAAGLQAALERVPQLTALRLSPPCQLPAFPAAVEGLHQLQRFEWGGPAPADPLLPAGPWLLQLLHVALPADTAAASLAVLSAAWQLESLAVGPFVQPARGRSRGSTPEPGSSGGSSGTGTSGSPDSSVAADSGSSEASCPGSTRPSQQLAVVGWAARHPPLQRLALRADTAVLAEDAGLAAALEAAAALRPGLQISCTAE